MLFVQQVRQPPFIPAESVTHCHGDSFIRHNLVLPSTIATLRIVYVVKRNSIHDPRQPCPSLRPLHATISSSSYIPHLPMQSTRLLARSSSTASLIHVATSPFLLHLHRTTPHPLPDVVCPRLRLEEVVLGVGLAEVGLGWIGSRVRVEEWKGPFDERT